MNDTEVLEFLLRNDPTDAGGDCGSDLGKDFYFGFTKGYIRGARYYWDKGITHERDKSKKLVDDLSQFLLELKGIYMRRHDGKPSIYEKWEFESVEKLINDIAQYKDSK